MDKEMGKDHPLRILLAEDWEIFATSAPIHSAADNLVHTIICAARDGALVHSRYAYLRRKSGPIDLRNFPGCRDHYEIDP